MTCDCQRCHGVFDPRDPDEPGELCDPCAHAVLAQLREVVTHDFESKTEFIARVNAILNPGRPK